LGCGIFKNPASAGFFYFLHHIGKSAEFRTKVTQGWHQRPVRKFQEILIGKRRPSNAIRQARTLSQEENCGGTNKKPAHAGFLRKRNDNIHFY